MLKQAKDYTGARLRSVTGADRLEADVQRLQESQQGYASSVTELSAQLARSASSIAELNSKCELATSSTVEIRNKIERAIGPRADYVIPPWYDWSFWEPTVQLVLRDLCRPGSVVLDAGANAAALTVLMSRLVGPRGLVFAFEASRRIIDKAQFNVVQAGCGNVQLFHRAVYKETGALLPIFKGEHLNDSIYASGGTASAETVRSIALDDFVEHWGVKPSVIKLDIEGAEFDALTGAQKLIREVKPHLILELWRDDTRCLDMLLRQGYRATDLSTYRPVLHTSDFDTSATVANMVFIHEDRLAETPFAQLRDPEVVKEVDQSKFDAIHLEPGRYVFEVIMSADRSDNEIMAGVECDAGMLLRYHTNTKFLADSYRFFPVHVDTATDVRLFFRFQSGTNDPTFNAGSARVWRVPGNFPSHVFC